MAMNATQPISNLLPAGIEVLEYGKFCASPDGPIESFGEYRILGHSNGFPQQLAQMCTPQQFGLAKNQVEMERFGLLASRGSGTVIRPVPIADKTFYLCYKISQRSEGGSRQYSLARYLCSQYPINPLVFYQAIGQLTGLTRQEVAELEPIKLKQTGPTDGERFSDAVVQRVRAGLLLQRPIYAVLNDEASFFRLAGSVWEALSGHQRALFSCGWNVSPQVGRTLVMAFGPTIPENASRLDPSKPAPTTQVGAKKSPPELHFKGIPELLDAGRPLLVRDAPVPNPLLGFDDPAFAEVFSGYRYEEALIQRIPEILQGGNRRFDTEIVRHLLRFDSSLQQSLFILLESTILGHPQALRAFDAIERQCRSEKKDWGETVQSAVRLAIRLQTASENARLAEFLLETEETDLNRSDDLPAFWDPLCKAISGLTGEQALMMHRRLLAAGAPGWYRKWLKANYREVVFLCLQAQDPEAIEGLGAVIGASPLIGIAKAIAGRKRAGPDDEEIIKKLDAEARANFANCLYGFWLNGERNFEDWQACFGFDMPPSLLKHALTQWEADNRQIRSDLRREFLKQKPEMRLRLAQCLRSLCDSDRKPDVATSDGIWADYLETDSESVVRATAGWSSPASSRLSLRRAVRNRQPVETVKWLLQAASDGSLSSLPEEDITAIDSVLDGLIGDVNCGETLDSLICGWPVWPPLQAWGMSRGLRGGAWLLQRENLRPEVFDAFIKVCGEPISRVLSAIKALTSVTPDVQRTREDGLLDRASAEWLARFLERQWGGTRSEKWESVVAWARWTGSDAYRDPTLRLLAGLPFDAEAIASGAQWTALAAAQNHHIPVHLALVRSILTGSFELSERPNDEPVRKVVSIVLDDPLFSGSARWRELWRNASSSWQRLFILEAAVHQGFEISIEEAAELKCEPEWLRRAVLARTRELGTNESTRRSDDFGPGLATTAARLNLADAEFQSLLYSSPDWTEDIAGTRLMGAFRLVPMKLYTDAIFRAVMSLYFPSLDQRKWAEDAAGGMTHFVKVFDPSSSDHHEALSLIDSGFFARYVCASPGLFKEHSIKSSDVRSAIFRAIEKERSQEPRWRRALHFGRSEEVVWSDLPKSFVAYDGKRILVDRHLKELAGLMFDLDLALTREE